MKKVALYIRVSTDEQAERGYSQRAQDETLTRFCEINDYQVVVKYYEDHSAKTFERPEFKKFLLHVAKNKKLVDLILFTKWDRFSRNAPDAYAMINKLHKLGVEPQAIEQPLNMEVPENKMMLAFYLAAPEVENDRRSLNTIAGMRRAQKEGNYIGKAPVGYKKIIQPDGNRILVPDENAEMVIEIFEQVATGLYTAESIFKLALDKGLPVKKNAFWNAIRNPFYMGKVMVKAYKNEDEDIVTGKHEAIIDEELFNRVQDVLDGRRKVQVTSITAHDKFPLRGLIKCVKHNRLLTASSSKGKTRYYDYYHCTSSCGVRYKADEVHQAMAKELAKWKPHQAVVALYKAMIDYRYQLQRKQIQAEVLKIKDEITRLQERQAKALEMVLQDKIEGDDFKKVKRDTEQAVLKQEQLLLEYSQMTEISPMIDKSLSVLLEIDKIYADAPATRKKEIVSSMFPEKLEFDGISFRTLRVNEAVELIFNIGVAFSEMKEGANLSVFQSAPLRVDGSTKFEPFSPLFIHDLKLLARLAA